MTAGKDIRGIDVNAKTQQVKRDNFEKILTFLASQRVRTSTVTSRDLATGNLKSLMRLILSLASHYKPHSVKQGRDSGNLSFQITIHTVFISIVEITINFMVFGDGQRM